MPLIQKRPLFLRRIFMREWSHFSGTGVRRGSSGVVPMIALLVENFKLVMLFLLIGTVIGLSHIPDGALTHMKHKKVSQTLVRNRAEIAVGD